MNDVYTRTTFERNSIQTIPSGYIDGAANNLYRFMGSFWQSIHEGKAFVQGLQKVRGIRVAQFYLDLLESLNLSNRRSLPVFHRELWKPLVIRRSQRNCAQENVLRLGSGGGTLGPQTTGSIYGEGRTLEIGSLASLEGYVTYPVDTEIESIVSGIANSVVNPTVVYTVGSEFPDKSHDVVYSRGTVIFPVDKDPFLPGSGFEPYDVPSSDVPEQSDAELVLWASDVLIDRDYLAEHMSYALGISCGSTEHAKRILNAGWDALCDGLTPIDLRALLAALVNVPTVQERSETVMRVYTSDDGSTCVRTDAHLYTLPACAVLRTCVKSGAVLRRGELLDQAVKIYPFLTGVSESRLSATTEYAGILRSDVPVLSIPRTIIRARTASGLTVDWNPKEVLDSGSVDANGHRKLYFDIDGDESDVASFWEDVWEHAERHGIDLDEVFSACEPDGSSSSETWTIVPAEFFLRHLVGANTVVVTIDRRQLEDVSMLRDPKFFNLLNKSLPENLRLFLVEHDEAGSEVYETSVSTEDSAEKHAYAEAEDEIDYTDLPGIRGHRQPTYEDAVEMKFFRDRRHRAE